MHHVSQSLMRHLAKIAQQRSLIAVDLYLGRPLRGVRWIRTGQADGMVLASPAGCVGKSSRDCTATGGVDRSSRLHWLDMSRNPAGHVEGQVTS